MQIFLIADNQDTVTGMRLAGVPGVIAKDRESLGNALNDALANPQIGIILLMESFGREYPDLIDDVKLNRRVPLIIEIPDRNGTGRRPDFITAYVGEAIGLKL